MKGPFIRSDAVLVPASHFQGTDGACALQLHLTIDMTEPPDDEPDVGRKHFEAFLNAAPTLEFRLCSFGDKQPEPAILDRLGPALEPVAGAVLGWLDQRTDVWHREAGDTGSSRTLTAGELLAASANWEPDLARNSGLVATLCVPAGARVEGKFVLPCPPGFVPDNIEWVEEDGAIYAAYTNTLTDERFTIQLLGIGEVPSGGNELLDQTTGMLRTAGGAAPDEQAHLVHEMLGALSLCAASQLSAAHALLGVNLPNSDAEQRNFGRFVFRGIATLTALFDPILLSLVMPGADDEGPFIGALIAALDDALSRSDPPSALDDELVDTTVTKLKRRIAASMSIASSARADRKAFAAKLRGLLEAAPDPEGGSGAPLWGELLDHFENYDPGTAPHWSVDFKDRSFADVEQQLAAELGRLLQWLESEDGCEAVALRLIAPCLTVDFPDELPLADKELALAALDERLRSDFHGADAARAAVGTLFADAFVRAARGRDQQWSAGDLRAVLAEDASNWFTGRIWKGARGGSVFEAILDVLPTIDPGFFDPGDADPVAPTGPLADQLTAAWRDARRHLFGNSDQLRFAASHVPLPLPVRINADADVDDGDVFAQNYSGLGVLIRRAGGEWSHANLATTAVPETPGDPLESDLLDRPLWVQPLDPAAVNGRRQLFQNYHGFAFFEADLGPNPVARVVVHDAPIHSIDAPHLVQIETAGLAPLPALAYGVTYDIAAFAILRGGLLPKALAAPDVPWKPRAGALMIADDFLARQVYCRTTMIGAVQLSGEGLQYSNAPGVGVQPLADDYPRKGFAANGEPAWLQLWRSGDGSGAIAVPNEGDTVRLTLDDISVWGSGTRLGLHIQSDRTSLLPDAATPQLSAMIPAACAGQRLELAIANQAGVITYTLGASGGGITITTTTYQPGLTDAGGDSDVPVFVRLCIESDAGSTSLSFADPAQMQRGGDDASSAPGSKVMLVAPTAGFITPRDKPNVTFRIDYPRVAYQDFERWLSNPKLAEKLIAKQEDVAVLLNLLLRSYIAGQPKLTERIASLPDPAVRHLLIELTPLDGIADDPATLASKYTAKREVIDLSSLDDVARAPTLDAMFAVIDRQFGAEWTVLEGNFWIDKAARTIFIPEGMTAQLSVRPLVLKDVFADIPALDPRLLQWVHGDIEVSSVGGAPAYIFEGPTRVIEMMADFAKSLPTFAERAFDFIGVRDAGAPRAYELFAAPPAEVGSGDWQWRRLASAEVKVQQWRFMGRPIVHWFDPKALSSSHASGTAALRLDSLDETSHADFEAFEAEAFLDRDDDDAQLYSVRLTPLDLGRDGGGGGASTSLHRFEWPDASATMVRHRLAVFSRYIGALAKPRIGRVEIIGPSQKPEWLRVVMLADAARLELTRPQLRALVPLTVASDLAKAPPVLALLDEAPLAHGGLAGRIAASIRTGLGYHIPKPIDGEAPPVLELFDARAEFGPDPQLRYHPTAIAAAQALTLVPEGPIGLTFDAGSVRAPAFANSAMILAPHILSRSGARAEADLQEHFISIALRRYLDHRWIVDETPHGPADVAASRSWWLECSGTETLHYDGKAFCTVTHADGLWKVAIADRKFVFAFGQSVEPLDLAAIDTDQANAIALLHQPLTNGRASLTVFAIPSAAAVASGIANTPLVLASVEWSALGGAQFDKLFEASPALVAWPVVASAETPMNWVRTARDSDRVTLADTSGHSEPYHVRDLRIIAASAAIAPRMGGSSGAYHLRPAHEDSNVVLELQRHLVLIKTRPLASAGQVTETYEGTHLVTGAALPIVKEDVGARARIAELEVQAVPIGLGAALTGDLTEYLSAHFDLAAIGGEKAGALAFWIRPAKPFRAFGAGFSLAFDLEGLAGSAWPTRRVELRPAGGGAIDCRTILLCADSTDIRAWFLTGAGDMVEAASPTITNSKAPTHSNIETVRIAGLAAQDGGGPLNSWWADIAKLTLKKMPAAGVLPKIELDFDWLFTGTLERPADAVSHSGLNSMKSVQARMFSPSEPIDIV